MDAIRVENITKAYTKGRPAAVDHISFAVAPGELFGLIGPDGAGKTTLFRILITLLLPDAGHASVDGYDIVRDYQKIRSTVGYMPGRFSLYTDLTVEENLHFFATVFNTTVSENYSLIRDLYEQIRPFKDRRAGKLSGGMKQKLGLACALVRTPKLLLLDEPGVGVDPVSRRELWAIVRALASEPIAGSAGGIGVLWSTAYLDEAEQCDHVYLLNAGQKLFGGPPAELVQGVKGRTFLLKGFAGGRRPLLERLLERDDVEDATIRGRAIRLLLARDVPIPLQADLGGDAAQLEPAPPHFEDGFIDALHGNVRGVSALAQAYRTIPASDRPAIEAVGLTKRFGDFTAAEDIRFTVGRGEIFGLLGPNGAGKSTTFKMLCGLLRPTEGNGSVAGFDLRHTAADARNALGYMAQKFSLYGDLSVAQNLDFFAGVYGLSRDAAHDAIARNIDIFDLKSHLGTNAGQLPLGYKQRLALACAVLHQPSVLFLDEPTSGVDPLTRREFWTHINGLVGKGVTVLVTTHFMEEAEYCDRVALIYRAREIATGTPEDLRHKAAAVANLDDPTLEDAFIALIEASDREREAREKQAA
jgi:ABC-2 type transport system ATP-binding protein